MVLDQLKKVLKLNSTSILHRLKELSDLNLISKHDKIYSLTFTGILVAMRIKISISNWGALESNKKFWQDHNTNGIDQLFLNHIWVWNKAKLVESDYVDFSKPSRVYAENIKESKTLKIILPIYSVNNFKIISKSLIDVKYHMDLITTENIYELIKDSDFGDRFLELINDGVITVYITEKLTGMYLICADNFVSLALFLNNGEYDRNQMIITKDSLAIQEANIIFDNYINNIINK